MKITKGGYNVDLPIKVNVYYYSFNEYIEANMKIHLLISNVDFDTGRKFSYSFYHTHKDRMGKIFGVSVRNINYPICKSLKGYEHAKDTGISPRYELYNYHYYGSGINNGEFGINDGFFNLEEAITEADEYTNRMKKINHQCYCDIYDIQDEKLVYSTFTNKKRYIIEHHTEIQGIIIIKAQFDDMRSLNRWINKRPKDYEYNIIDTYISINK